MVDCFYTSSLPHLQHLYCKRERSQDLYILDRRALQSVMYHFYRSSCFLWFWFRFPRLSLPSDFLDHSSDIIILWAVYFIPSPTHNFYFQYHDFSYFPRSLKLSGYIFAVFLQQSTHRMISAVLIGLLDINDKNPPLSNFFDTLPYIVICTETIYISAKMGIYISMHVLINNIYTYCFLDVCLYILRWLYCCERDGAH